MKIGLLDIDCHASKKKWGATIYPNLAICKISAYHKSKGDLVEWATPFTHYDIIYRSKIFNFSEDDLTVYDCDKEIRGGTGYDIHSELPKEIDDMQPDYSIYPNVPHDTAYGFLTRGCPRKCEWCVVPRKEGFVRPYWDIDRVANGRPKVVLMDNNILAAGRYCLEQLQKIIDHGYQVDFNQALDARLVTPKKAALLAKIKWIDNRIRFGCDTKEQIEECESAMKMIDQEGYKGQYFLYTMLIGDFRECYERVHRIWELNEEVKKLHTAKRIYAHSQPFRDPDRKNTIPQWQIDLAQWTNKKQLFDKVDFKDFKIRVNFCCGTYLEREYGRVI